MEKEDHRKIFGKGLTLQRKRKGRTQQSVADELGIKRSRLGGWEEGRAYPSVDMVLRLSNAYGVSVDFLIQDAPILAKAFELQRKTAI
jgi:transcriptional regulator with XRE-family HTH domain